MTFTAAFVKSVRRQGGRPADRYGDGRGLMLQVMPSGSKQWLHRLALNGTRRASPAHRERGGRAQGACPGGGLPQRASTAMMVADGREAAPAPSPEAPGAGVADAPWRRDTNGNRRITCHEALARRRLGAGARLGASCATGRQRRGVRAKARTGTHDRQPGNGGRFSWYSS